MNVKERTRLECGKAKKTNGNTYGPSVCKRKQHQCGWMTLKRRNEAFANILVQSFPTTHWVGRVRVQHIYDSGGVSGVSEVSLADSQFH